MKKILEKLKRDLNEKIESIKHELEEVEENIQKLDKLQDILSLNSLFAADTEDFVPQNDPNMKKLFESLGYDINDVNFDNPEELSEGITKIKEAAISDIQEIKKTVSLYEEQLSSIQENIKYNSKDIFDYLNEKDEDANLGVDIK